MAVPHHSSDKHLIMHGTTSQYYHTNLFPFHCTKLRKVTWWTRKAEQEPELTDDEDDEEVERKRQVEQDAYIDPSGEWLMLLMLTLLTL